MLVLSSRKSQHKQLVFLVFLYYLCETKNIHLTASQLRGSNCYDSLVLYSGLTNIGKLTHIFYLLDANL
jgi:hypothetical protein